MSTRRQPQLELPARPRPVSRLAFSPLIAELLSSAPCAPPVSSEPECQICMSASATHAAIPCGHHAFSATLRRSSQTALFVGHQCPVSFESTNAAFSSSTVTAVNRSRQATASCLRHQYALHAFIALCFASPSRGGTRWQRPQLSIDTINKSWCRGRCLLVLKNPPGLVDLGHPRARLLLLLLLLGVGCTSSEICARVKEGGAAPGSHAVVLGRAVHHNRVATGLHLRRRHIPEAVSSNVTALH
jgi:hypothetical protein